MQLNLSWCSLGLATLFAMFVTPRAPAAIPGPARSPAHLAALLARYDRASPDEQRALEPQLDAMAGQRYAASARLFWYTDLDEAKQAARQLGRPILSLRMLGDLRDDLSCANSRLFRATLYANTKVAALLRDQFVLYWSSERAVPVVTIEFGDGRKIVRTVTGNSAHYVLDADGHVLDVLPGLYAPDVFRAELTRSLQLARTVRSLPDAGRIRAVADYHRAAADAADAAWRAAHGVQYIHGQRTLPGAGDLSRAQRATMSKMIVEVPDLRTIGLLDASELPLDDLAGWAAAGLQLWHLAPAPVPGAPAPTPTPLVVFDGPSRSLIARLHNAGPDGAHTTPAQLDSVIARLEQHVIADSAINELRLRPQIHRHLAQAAGTDFAQLNDWIYGTVFATPKSDPWLGLNARSDFSGLPGDGVVVP